MPQASEAHAWWSEVEDVRERIERRRAREVASQRSQRNVGQFVTPAPRRGVREIRTDKRLAPVPTGAPATKDRPDTRDAPVARDARRARDAHATDVRARRRPRPRMAHRVGSRPDRAAAWAVALGFLLVVMAMLSAHG
jgi:hypothetical protein